MKKLISSPRFKMLLGVFIIKKVIMAVIFFFFFSNSGTSQTKNYQNTQLSFEERAVDIENTMTLIK